MAEVNTAMSGLQIVTLVAGSSVVATLLAKMLDIFWLQQTTQRIERRKWMRDQRLRIYTEISKEIRFNQHEGRERSNIIAELSLFIDDETLLRRIENYFVVDPELSRTTSLGAEELGISENERLGIIEAERKKHIAEAQEIIKELRQSLMNT